MQARAHILLRFFLMFGLLGLILFSGCEEDEQEPLIREPIRLHKPDSQIVQLPSDTTIPIKIELLLPANVDSLTGTYQLNRSPFVPIFTKSYPGTSNDTLYEDEFNVPDSLKDGTDIRCEFTAFDVNDSTYLKTLRIDIVNN